MIAIEVVALAGWVVATVANPSIGIWMRLPPALAVAVVEVVPTAMNRLYLLILQHATTTTTANVTEPHANATREIGILETETPETAIVIAAILVPDVIATTRLLCDEREAEVPNGRGGRGCRTARGRYTGGDKDWRMSLLCCLAGCLRVFLLLIRVFTHITT
jgi:hypothetical protein